MGILSRRNTGSSSELARLPAGSFTVDCNGQLLVSTLPQSYPEATLLEIAQQAITTFRSAREAQLSLSEIVVNYAAFKVTARELRGGAIIFLAPRTLGPNPNRIPFL